MKTTPAMDKLIGEAVLMRGRGTAAIHRGRWGVAGNAATLKGLVARGLAEIVEDWHVLTESGEARRVSMLPVVDVVPVTTSTAETLAALALITDAQDILATDEAHWADVAAADELIAQGADIDQRAQIWDMPGDVERAAQVDEDAATYAEILAEQDRDEPMPGGEAVPWKSRKGKHGRHGRNR